MAGYTSANTIPINMHKTIQMGVSFKKQAKQAITDGATAKSFNIQE